MKNIYLFGAGGHALSCIDVIEKEKKYKIIGLFDNKFSQKDKVLNYPILDQKKIFKARGEDAANKIVLILRPEDAENKTYLLKIFNWLNIFIILLRWLRIIRIKNLNNKHTIQKKTKKNNLDNKVMA